MPRYQTLRMVGLLLVILLLAACGKNSSETATDQDATIQPSTEANTVSGRPDAPAPVDGGFRSDPAHLVGATGNPQLLEFFTYW